MPVRIMVIGENQEILELFGVILEEEGYQVYLQTFTPEHRLKVEPILPDMIILDLLLHAQHQGWNMIQQLKLSEATASIPLLLCTNAVAAVQEQEVSLRQKGITLLLKPFSINDLKCMVRRLLQPGESL